MRYYSGMEDQNNQTDKPAWPSAHQDTVLDDGRGMLIPSPLSNRLNYKSRRSSQFTPVSALMIQRMRFFRLALVAVSVFALVIVSGAGFAYVAGTGQVATPVFSIADRYAGAEVPITPGPQPVLVKRSLYENVRDEYIDAKQTFIEVDLLQKQLRFFKNGVLFHSADILKTADPGSWRDVPAGLYQVEQKDKLVFSSVGQVNLPWRILFQNNFTIHGWPTYPDGTAVFEEFSGGGIRLDNKKAEELYQQVAIGTPILVYKEEKLASASTFVYHSQVPDLGARHYFVADIENGSVLAASDLDEVAPIASLTKLMTAVVASEKLDMDGRVRATEQTFVQSLVPRLKTGSSVSLYSLLQLLLVESSNEAAETIAGELGREEFITAMNDKARQLGMLNTTFVDPSGLDQGNVSTGRDLFRLVSYLYQERKFILEITDNGTVPDSYVGDEFSGLVNFNHLQGVEGFVGGKVGETTAAGQTSISVHEIPFGNETRVVVVIVLGSEGRTKDVGDLITYIKQNYQGD